MIKIIPVTFKACKAKRSSGDRKQNFEFCQWWDFKNGGKRDHLPVFVINTIYNKYLIA